MLEGRVEDHALTFFAERRFPTPESGILLKELWPFAQDKPLIFKLRKVSDRWVIVSVEKNRGGQDNVDQAIGSARRLLQKTSDPSALADGQSAGFRREAAGDDVD